MTRLDMDTSAAAIGKSVALNTLPPKKSFAFMYRDWIKNFISIARFAEYYNVTEKNAYEIIKIGAKFNNTGRGK